MLETHPLAEAFPLIEGKEFEELTASVKKHGLINPIILLDGRIIDGRNRYRACLAAGVEPDFMEFEETDPARQEGLVEALNVHRRHLTESQRAMIAARFAKGGVLQEEAARQMNVGTRSVEKAAAIMRSGDTNVIDLVSRGKTSVTRAEQVVKGQLPRTALTEGRGRPGRPVGDTHIRRLSKAVDAVLALRGTKGKMVSRWPGDPDFNARVREAAEFLRSLEAETQEEKRAASVS